ncbi:MAG: hypothetical protein M0R38_01325 [Bacteroidia bacterium]|nr:hypothetical protein [Bacteroidia bacterium]
MKNLILSFTITALIAGGMMTYSSCNKDKTVSGKEVTEQNTEENSPTTPNCCTVTCKAGTCSATEAPCNCTCSFWGDPKCSGGSDTYTLSQVHLDNIVNMINFLISLESSNTGSAAVHLYNYKDAVLANNQALANTEIESYRSACKQMSTSHQTDYRSFIETLPF